jgi:hypothetical protein
MTGRVGSVALLLAGCVVGALPAQEPGRHFEAGPVVWLVRDQGAMRGIGYDQRASFIGAGGGARLGPVVFRGYYLGGTLPAFGDTMPSRATALWEAGAGYVLNRGLRLDGAVWCRSYSSVLGDQRWAGYRVGVIVSGDLLPGVVSAGAAGHYVPAASSSSSAEKLKVGWSGEVGLSVHPARLPVRFSASYRVERIDFSVQGSGAATAIARQMRLMSVTLAAALSL